MAALGYLPFTWENRKFRMENQRVQAIPFGKLQKKWAVFYDDVVFLLFLVCSADLDMVCSGSSSHHAKFYILMFMHRISTRVVCVNSKHPLNIITHCPFANLSDCNRCRGKLLIELSHKKAICPSIYAICGLSLLLVLSFAQGFFSRYS